MSDFLKNLVARSRGARGAISPRLGSRFEPQAPEGDAGPLEVDEEQDTASPLSIRLSRRVDRSSPPPVADPPARSIPIAVARAREASERRVRTAASPVALALVHPTSRSRRALRAGRADRGVGAGCLDARRAARSRG